jgi:hypothetical protein
VRKSWNTDDSGEASLVGYAPMPRTTPTTTSAPKNIRCFHRTVTMPTNVSASTPNCTAITGRFSR